MTHGTLARLKRQLKHHGITQERVAQEAGVTRPLVVNLLAGRTTSANVIAVAKRLIAEARQAKAPAEQAS